jgi:hypothetical protein
MNPLDRLKCHGRVMLSSSSDTQPGALPTNENAEDVLQLLLSFRNSAPSVTTDLLNSASMVDEEAPRSIENWKNLQQPAFSTPIVPPASSVANGMLTLEQQLASLNEELQRRHNNHQLAFLIEQQRGMCQGSSQAKNSIRKRIPSIEQQLPSLTDKQLHQCGSYQASSDKKRVSFCIEEPIAALTEQHEVRRAPFQDRKPTSIEQRLATLNRPASTSPTCRLPPHLPTEHHTSHVSSLEQLQLLAQLQRDIVPQTQPEMQAPSGDYPFRNAVQGHLMGSLVQSGPPTEGQLPIPPAFTPREPFPGKLYRLLEEAGRNGNEHIISFTPDGLAFKIHSRETFVREVSPAYFSQARITSFVRQLNLYGFEKLMDGPNRGGFGHPYFRRGRPELLRMIERNAVVAAAEAKQPKKKRGQRTVVAAAARVKKDRGRGRQSG